MSRIEEKLYLQHVFDAIDQVYQIRTPYSSNYEERLRHSLNKLFIPEWYKHHSNLSFSTRQKSRSQGQVRHLFDRENDLKTTNKTQNNKDNQSSNSLLTSSNCQRFSSSSIEIDDRKRRQSSSRNLYSSGRQRVSQSSTWYKPTSLMIQSSRQDQMIIALRTNERLSLPVANMSNENLQQTDSSSYASVNESSLSISTSTSSYHTARQSSNSGYETPTLQLETIPTSSTSSSLSDLTLAEASDEDLDIVAISTVEEKPDVTVVGMENLSLPLVPSPTTTSSLNSETSPSSESRANENLHWYDDGSIETCIHQNSLPTSTKSAEEDIDMNGLNASSSQHTPTDEEFQSLTLAKDKNFNEDFLFSDDPIDSKANSSMMITNLDDLLIEDDDDDDQHLSKDLLNSNYRRPIQEDILYEVEHENSLSEHSQGASTVLTPSQPQTPQIPVQTPDPTLNLTSAPPPRSHSPPEVISSPSVRIDRVMPSDTTNTPVSFSYSSSSRSPLRVDTSYTTPQWTFFTHTSTNSSDTLPSYTSKIRQRHFSVGSYYDNRTTTITLHPTQPYYLLGSAPVSPLNRPVLSTTCADLTHQRRHQSPISYGTATFNALRRVNPFFDTYSAPISHDDAGHHFGEQQQNQQQQQQRTPIPPTPVRPRNRSPSPPTPVRPRNRSPSPPAPVRSRNRSPSPPAPHPPPVPQRLDEPTLVRPKTSRGRQPLRMSSIEKEPETISTDDDRTTTPQTDLKFIRGTIQRVFEFHPESTSESLTINDDVSEEKDGKNLDEPSVSLSSHSSKAKIAHPSVEAVQQFYHKNGSDEERKKINNNHVQVTDLDQVRDISQSSGSNPLINRSHPANPRQKPIVLSSDDEEVDDTLNDIEDEDSHDEKIKRSMMNGSSLTSDENSPVHSNTQVIKSKKTSQETQTHDRQPPIILTTASPSDSNGNHITRSTVPPLDIVTQMVIERDDGYDDGQIGEIEGDMIIFYDDIEIVEHSSNISETESDSYSSTSQSLKVNKSPALEQASTTTTLKQVPISIVQTPIGASKSAPPVAPPIPARTLKPLHLLNDSTHQTPITASPSRVNRTYELEKPQPRKKIDINSVNDMLNRTEPLIGPAVSHRLPSARHFVGKLNSDDSSSRSSSVVTTATTTKPVIATTPTTTIVKSKTLPLQTPPVNGTPSKMSVGTLPTRSVSSVGANDVRRSVLPDTNALVKQIQNSLSRNSLHDEKLTKPLSISTKDLRTFVSSTYSPSDENMIDDNGVVHRRRNNNNNNDKNNSNNDDDDDQAFKRQARLSKSFHNVSEYDTPTNRSQPSKSVERITTKSRPLNFPPVVASTSFSALPRQDENNRMLSMKWYTGQVSDNSEIWSNTPSNGNQDLLSGYISMHGNAETQSLFARLQTSNDIRVHAALDDIRLRVVQFDASKSAQDLHMFMRYLESRVRDLAQKTFARENSDTVSIKSRASSTANIAQRATPTTLPRQYGRKHGSSSNLQGGLTTTTTTTNGHHHGPVAPPRRISQSSTNQENPHEFDDMLNTVLGLQQKKGVPNHSFPVPQQNRDPVTPSTPNDNPKAAGREIGKRLFESGIYQDPRLIYDGPKRNEKEEQPLESSV